ncbi:MAG: type II secretion system protein [Sedimentisphaerales bacterium]|nr:type II secretion system protein [Sedimentisphaerales bacterium]
MKKKGFTLIELLVVIAIIAMLLAILMPALNKVKKIAQRVVCGTNLKGLGTAQSVYANDYEDQFTRQGAGISGLTWNTSFAGWQSPTDPWRAVGTTEITIGASLYLLVREADVSPKSFVCTAGGQTAFDGRNDNDLDLVELWDFGSIDKGSTAVIGTGPTNCVSYSFHDPYGRYAAGGTATASFAVMADKSPWFDSKLSKNSSGTNETNWTGRISPLGDYWARSCAKWEIQRANSYPHAREGQNVLYGDGHSSYEKESDCGVKHDNIYTIQRPAGLVADVRQGITNPATYVITPDFNTLDPAIAEDSVLMNDDVCQP